MQFKATDAQILEVFRLAINASMAMGLGMIHYQAKDWDTEKVTTIFEPTDHYAGLRRGAHG